MNGAETIWIASSGANRPDADTLGVPLTPQLVTIQPRSILPTTATGLGVGAVATQPLDLKALLATVGPCYESAEFAGYGTVAGQPVKVVEFVRRSDCMSSPIPDFAGTAARRLSFDTTTGLVLKDESLAGSGAPIPGGTTEFTSIDYHADLPDSLFEFEPAHGAIIRRCADLQCGSTSFAERQSYEGLEDYTVIALHATFTNERTDHFAEVRLNG